MASRRTRIKGIANIHQRRKATTDVILPTADENGLKDSSKPNLSPPDPDNKMIGKTIEFEPEPEPEPAEIPATTTSLAYVSEEAKPPVSVPKFNRRRIIKPAISLKAINKSGPPNSGNSNTPESKTRKDEPGVPENGITISKCNETTRKTTENGIEGDKSNNYEDSSVQSAKIDDQISPKDNHEDNNTLGITKLPLLQNIASDHANNVVEASVELNRPPPPTSPNKFMSRGRIKAVPRLGQRRTSFSIGSASESEDESKKTYKRIRNDSVCSTISTSVPAPAPVESSMVNLVPSENNTSRKKNTEFNTVIQRKCKRTEQSRKLAEARRDFQLKFNNGKPDRQKLTMIDLIFYNPTSSPMSQKRKRKDTESESIISQKEEGGEEEVDNPPEPESDDNPPPEAEPSDEENTVPAPQITIGENGEIVIDEKSLFIENKDVKRERETLKNSSLVDGDTFDNSYGVFKRFKRSKDWCKAETLRFYKALNTLGTDFTLMCDFFPGRSRRELKMKFKKEERVNRTLIDRAVMQPIQFDISDLQRELEIQELEKLRQQQLKKDKGQFKQDKKAVGKEKVEVASMKKRCRRTRTSRVQNQQPSEVEPEPMPKLRKRLQLGINALLDSDDEDVDETSRQSEESHLDLPALEENNSHLEAKTAEIEIATNGNDTDSVINENEEIEDSNWTLTEGSIIFSKSLNENGEDTYHVQSVNQNGEKIPVQITPEILELLIRNENNNDNDDCNDSVVLASDNTVADISLSNIKDQTISNISMTTDCLILPFDDDGDVLSSTNLVASVVEIGP